MNIKNIMKIILVTSFISACSKSNPPTNAKDKKDWYISHQDIMADKLLECNHWYYAWGLFSNNCTYADIAYKNVHPF